MPTRIVPAREPSSTPAYAATSEWAKLLMIIESAASLLLAIMVVARAVNILH